MGLAAMSQRKAAIHHATAVVVEGNNDFAVIRWIEMTALKFVIEFQVAFFHSHFEFVAASTKAISCFLTTRYTIMDWLVHMMIFTVEWPWSSLTYSTAKVSFMFILRSIATPDLSW